MTNTVLSSSKILESLRYSEGKLQVIDQLKLPDEFEYVDVCDANDAFNVIRSMQVRGAPLIAVVACLGLAVELRAKKNTFSSVQAAQEHILERIIHLRASRPTAVNLFVATDELRALVTATASATGATAASLCDAVITYAEVMLAEDIATNKRIGDHGAQKLLSLIPRDKLRVLTICNTGSLATAGYGTALGVVRSLHAAGRLETIYACETRPYNQGSRLTSFEIVADQLPGVLITDSMAAALMSTKGVDCVVVGADRVTANGDTANKIGTYQLAIIAKYHNIPFFVAAPITTLDLTLSDGSHIPIEERPGVEMTSILGKRIAPDGIKVWNPAFDVTPSSLIAGVITDLGVAEAGAHADGVIDMVAFVTHKGLKERTANAAVPIAAPSGYTRFDEGGIRDYVLHIPALRAKIGYNAATCALSDVSVTEVGDGNLNLVYIVRGPSGTIVVKQALPYVRCVGESWPLTSERAEFEMRALTAEKQMSDKYVPAVYHFDKKNYLFIMEYIAPPHLILRKHMIACTRLSSLADHLSTFLAQTLFRSSDLSIDGKTLRDGVAAWSRNTAMCGLTEQVIFTDPYTTAKFNHWTTPHLDEYVSGIQSDDVLKAAVANLKHKFLTATEALLHADLHTGSIMAMEGSTYIIDPEFAFYGPMGFDTGLLLANYLMSYFSHIGRGNMEYAEWILEMTASCFVQFREKFLALWEESTGGEMFGTVKFSSMNSVHDAFLRHVWMDTLGFAGCEMIRRIVGIAHVEDLESITDANVRSSCEKKCLTFARTLILMSAGVFTASHQEAFAGPKELVDAAARIASAEVPVQWLH